MARSPGFGSAPYYSSRPLKTRFRFGSVLSDLTSHHGTTRRFILQKARHHPLTGSDFFQAHGFRFSFTPLPRFFSPFPHGTSSLSLTRLYSALADGPACFRQDSSCLVVLRILLASASSFAYRALAVSGCASHHIRLFFRFRFHRSSFNPISLWFGLLPFRSPLLGESLLFSFPPGTWMFRFPGYLSLSGWHPCIGCRVPPFGYRRVFASLQLGAAFRSSVRPSSVTSGKAFSVRPCLLDQLVLFF